MRVWPGQPCPLGASWDGEGVNFALYSEGAESVELCLFDAHHVETQRIRLSDPTNMVWHTYLPDVRPGQLYGYRCHGPYAPEQGFRFNASKLLLDPYALAIDGPLRWNDACFGFAAGSPQADLSYDSRDSAPFVPKAVVVDSSFAWGDDRRPQIPWNRTLIYECHVKGLTMRHPDIPEGLRGKYLALASEPIIRHLQRLGVTAVELLPVHQAYTERAVAERGLTNYWGYSTLGFFAPDGRYARGSAGQQVQEFKSMVKGLHRAGIEVILDVVYNHTAEDSHLGPTLSFRGIDNATYYRLNPANRRYYEDFTGCGNSLNIAHFRTLQLVLDSLRYWVEEMHVDGFRFDLATTLARGANGFERSGAFFATVQQDPVLSRVKLIAEPWDLGPGGYQVGNFPAGWSEWNDKYRDTVRSFWRGDPGRVGELASRLSGSSDLFFSSRRNPCASVNFVTCHDGFTLADLVSYDRKHNQANGEHNRDGNDHNLSRNWGVEGPTERRDILAMRERMKRNFLATLAFSLGVPMICAGDEMGQTQKGNNNAYCQDNELSWTNWKLGTAQEELLSFATLVFAIRRVNPVLSRCRYYRGTAVGQTGVKDVTWVRPDGAEMTPTDWNDAKRASLAMLIHGQTEGQVDARGRIIETHTLLLIVNAAERPARYRFPTIAEPGLWHWLLDTACPQIPTVAIRNRTVRVLPHSLILLNYQADP